MFPTESQPYRRLLLLYGATIAVPTCVLVWLGLQSFRRQDEAIARLTAERVQAEIDRRVQAAASAALDGAPQPITRHFFAMVDGVLVEPVLDSPPRRPTPPELAKAEHEELVLERPDLAVASYRREMTAGPLGHLVRARIARCLDKLGRRDEARAAWRELAAAAPDAVDLAHRPYGVVAAIEAGDTGGLYEQIESGRWNLAGDHAEHFLAKLDAERTSAYLERFAFARAVREHFRPAAVLADGDLGVYEMGERRIFYRAEGSRVLGFAADLDWIDGPLRAQVERDLRSSSAGLDERWLYGGAVSLVLLVLSSGLLLIWRDVSREATTSRLRAEFVSSVTHDLKTPITLVRLYGETLLRHHSLSDDERRDAYRVIARESTRLGRLVDQVLSFGRVERGQQTYELEEGDVAPVVAGVVDDYTDWLTHAGFVVSRDLPASLPPVRFDPEALSQAVINLLDNAVKYAGASNAIGIRLAAVDRHVQLEIEDHGVGIPAGEQARIFERFYRVHNSAGKGGYGLGLYMVRHIVEAHGGEVAVTSAPGQGSTFLVRLPIVGSDGCRESFLSS
jgi:signal transduction histidine kinase